MSLGRSTIRPRLEELDALSAPASSLRRRSSIHRLAEPVHVVENDDEAERLQRRLDKKQLQVGEGQKHRSMELCFVPKMSNSQIANSMTQYINLSSENKINVKNAFSLEMIDFMTYMIKQHNNHTSNLHVASTWLDVSIKIYGFRVDSVHADTLKMIRSLDKQEKKDVRWDSGLGAKNSDSGSDNDFEDKRTQRAKRKKSKQKILASAESLRAPLDLIIPASMMIAEPDLQTTTMLFQAVLPVHANWDLYLHPYDDVILDTVNSELEAEMNNAPIDVLCLERFGHLDLCPSFAHFKFLGWSAEEELELTLEASSQPPVENDDFQFDLQATLTADDESGLSGMNYLEMVDDDNEKIEVDDTMNVQNVLQRYSTDNIDGSRIVEVCTQESVKRSVNALTFNNESSEGAVDKFEIVKNEPLTLDRKTMKVAWSEGKLTLPADVDSDLQCCNYFLRPEVIKKFPQDEETHGTFLPVEIDDYDYNDYCLNIKTEDDQAGNEENCINVADFKEDVGDYDYNNNENDATDYGSNIETDNRRADNQESCCNGADLEEHVASPSQGFTGDNLVETPTMIKRIFIPFLRRAKKIDMRDFKRAIWKDLTSTVGDEDNVDVVEISGDNVDKVNCSKKFSDLVKNLPKRLTERNAEALSVPNAFAALLHLANEKNLQIDSSDDGIDLYIRQA